MRWSFADEETREEVARFEPQGSGGSEPALLRSVHRMKAANDRLKKAPRASGVAAQRRLSRVGPESRRDEK